MTRKHFKAIADTIKNLQVSDEDRKQIATAFAFTCDGFNNHFNLDKFIEACIS
jgi:hypothetical protein